MESGLKNAWIIAAVKSALGLLFVGSLVAIRIVTASPAPDDATAGSSADVAVDSSSLSAASGTPDSQAESSARSLVARATASLKEQVTGGRSRSDGGDRMVSCRIRGRVQFMTADDCAVRGGSASRLGDDR